METLSALEPICRLLEKIVLTRVSALPTFKMPPPPLLPTARPCVMVRPAMVTVTPFLMAKTRLVSLPLTASRSAPGPWMFRLLLIVSWSLVSVMVWPARLASKTIVSPSSGVADRIAQGARAVVEVVQDRQGAEDGPIFEDFEPRHEGSLVAGRVAGGSSGGAEDRDFTDRSREVNHIAGVSCEGGGLRYNDQAIIPVRRPSAGAMPGR